MIFAVSIIPGGLKEKAKRANELYRNQKYQDALDIYKRINKEVKSFGIYYNIANTYYKMDKLAHAKLYYLKALKIEPDNKKAIDNLKLVKSQLKNQIKPPKKNFFNRILEKISRIFSLNISSLISFVLLIISSVLFYYKNLKNRKKYLIISVSLLVIFILFTGISYSRYSRTKYIYLDKKIQARSEPNKDNTAIFTVYGGNEFTIKNRTGDWYLVVLKNGYTGWIKVKNQNQIGKI